MRDGGVGGHGRVPLATPTMQVVQNSWMRLVTRRAIGVWVCVIGESAVPFIMKITPRAPYKRSGH